MFRTPYNYGDRSPGFECLTPSHTQQHFADETDINQLVAQAINTGNLDALLSSDRTKVSYRDVSNIADYQRSLEIVLDVEDEFSSLPAVLRRHFNDDAGAYVDFVTNPENYDAAVELGIFNKTADASSVTPDDVAAVEQPTGASASSSKAADDAGNSSS